MFISIYLQLVKLAIIGIWHQLFTSYWQKSFNFFSEKIIQIKKIYLAKKAIKTHCPNIETIQKDK